MRHMRLDRSMRCASLMSFLAAMACSAPDVSSPASADVSAAYWALALNAHQITMSTVAPYDTLQLAATPLTADGHPLSGAPMPTFTTSDSSVRISSTGLLTARAERSDVQVVADLTYQGIHLADTAFVTVTAEAHPPTSPVLVLGLMPGDSAKIAAPRQLSYFYFPMRKPVRVEVQDGMGTAVPGISVALRVSDNRQASVSSSVNDGSAQVAISYLTSYLGPVTVYASAAVYGKRLQDSLQLHVTEPLHAMFNVATEIPAGSTVPHVTIDPTVPMVIGAGGIVWWWNTSSDSLDIAFDDSAAALADAILDSGSGNIAPYAGGADLDLPFIRARKFARPGTFHFHSVRTGITGTIIVR